MAVDTRPFPRNVRVAVRNDNKPEPNSSDKFSGHCQFQYDGELYDFPPGKPVVISPEAAYHIFLFDTRNEVDRSGRELDKPRNYRDTMSTGAIGNSGIGQQPSLYMQRLMSYGWANDTDKQRRFDKFTIKVLAFNAALDAETFNKLTAGPVASAATA